ncbi:hypothetical protein BL250_03050 [Erwinia sp. OLTSP20]|uniref:hypothetical protein n=1 Tax=unclassified Erwinia TaxID=2622719 RepID=UPI000C194C2B|nr:MULTISPECIES: hypothetical protein [unclassified Erwinia]PIJ51954.1 hypothetical protein BV501_01945 [Erwinia sp. OAMSP11]PIJ74829.1 hypothetical protein BK416_03285 [Erwinia sp. OLSSP12]PIJ85215.1 hypothetical protein BLD47_01025 [Erwinia sp. OLCASP19]PIJ87216.1 hypothetical protein BLD46_01420 [Erwinia sp. OLMTSP26]PIJ88360.1 hypothetical protein BLD49_02475 [Erwinia sp. OLMDSP33]
MVKYPKGSRVKHQTGDITGVVVNVFEQDNQHCGYYVKWDDGSHSYHAEQELTQADNNRTRWSQ